MCVAMQFSPFRLEGMHMAISSHSAPVLQCITHRTPPQRPAQGRKQTSAAWRARGTCGQANGWAAAGRRLFCTVLGIRARHATRRLLAMPHGKCA